MEQAKDIAARHDLAQPKIESTALAASSSLRLSSAEYSTLVVEFEALARRYPSQDVEESTDVYLADFEALALKFSLQSVIRATRSLRITAGRRFFPRPDEIAEEIERVQDIERAQRAATSRAERRKQEIEEFWKWAPQWMQDTGNDEAELLRRHPAFRGTKPSEATGGATR